jgi:hypothetical protein
VLAEAELYINDDDVLNSRIALALIGVLLSIERALGVLSDLRLLG